MLSHLSFQLSLSDNTIHRPSAGVEDRALGGIVMTTGPILSSVTLRCVCDLLKILMLKGYVVFPWSSAL